MSQEFECNVTASILESGRVLAGTAHTGAVVAGFGVMFAHSPFARIIFAAVILCWVAECWLASRVAIDASLFRALSTELEGGKNLDELLTRWGLRKNLKTRSIAERSQAAIRLWRLQIGGLAAELLLLVTGITVEALRF